MHVRFGSACLLLILGLIPTHEAASGPTVHFVNGNRPQRERMLAGVDRFRAIGLELPPLAISFFSDNAACDGHQGLFRGDEVLICSQADFVYEHELAHAWIETNVDDQVRREFMALRGYDNWFDPASPWNERGSEDAAFVIQQGLLDEPLPATLNGEWKKRLEAFELLTGRGSPRSSVP